MCRQVSARSGPSAGPSILNAVRGASLDNRPGTFACKQPLTGYVSHVGRVVFAHLCSSA
jgi:hypothetical protein